MMVVESECETAPQVPADPAHRQADSGAHSGPPEPNQTKTYFKLLQAIHHSEI